MLDRRLRAGVERGLGPVGASLGRHGVTPDALTWFGLAVAVATAFVIASGHLGWAVLGIALSGLGDLLDGNLARSTGRSGPRGSFFDSVADRVSDAVVLGGAGWYLARDSAHLPMLAFAVAVLSMLISYERAKAEALGLTARGGLMERAERSVLLAIGLAFGALAAVLWIMLVLCALTAVHRFVKVWRAASRPVATLDDTGHERGRARRIRRIAPRRSEREASRNARMRDWWEAHGPAARASRAADRRPSASRRHRTRRRPTNA
jgi:CDP-diacylglycerol--glycerol-3-phosphate 3-phosphatidyltransferase